MSESMSFSVTACHNAVANHKQKLQALIVRQHELQREIDTCRDTLQYYTAMTNDEDTITEADDDDDDDDTNNKKRRRQDEEILEVELEVGRQRSLKTCKSKKNSITVEVLRCLDPTSIAKKCIFVQLWVQRFGMNIIPVNKIKILAIDAGFSAKHHLSTGSELHWFLTAYSNQTPTGPPEGRKKKQYPLGLTFPFAKYTYNVGYQLSANFFTQG